MNGITSRRTFLQQSSALAAAGALRGQGSASARPAVTRRPPPVDASILIGDPTVRALALRALEAAKAAGASYADVRLTRTLTQLVNASPGVVRGMLHVAGLTGDQEEYAVGVRAMVRGAWGFASSPYWTPEEVVTLARSAVAQAQVHARGPARPADFAPAPVASGSWVMPVKIDPFTIPIEERAEQLGALEVLAERFGRDISGYQKTEGSFQNLMAWRQEQALATTEGAYVTQTVYRTQVPFTLNYSPPVFGTPLQIPAANLALQAVGWEILADAHLEAQLPALLAAGKEMAKLQLAATPGDIGKYDVVFDAGTMAGLVDSTLGAPTQLDRALGYEANASGTSYLTDPLAMVGSYPMGSPLLNLTADRSTPGNLAWVKWDDEGVEPKPFTLVKDGVLTDFQTTREFAPLLAPYYQQAGLPAGSRGCARAETANDVTLPQMPDLTLASSADDVSVDNLIRDTKKGFFVARADLSLDYQGRTGVGNPNGAAMVRAITNGRLGPLVTGLGFLFSSAEFWKNLRAVGGPRTAVRFPFPTKKGQPEQSTYHTVTAVPAKVTDLSFIDPSRRA